MKMPNQPKQRFIGWLAMFSMITFATVVAGPTPVAACSPPDDGAPSYSELDLDETVAFATAVVLARTDVSDDWYRAGVYGLRHAWLPPRADGDAAELTQDLSETLWVRNSGRLRSDEECFFGNDIPSVGVSSSIVAIGSDGSLTPVLRIRDDGSAFDAAFLSEEFGSPIEIEPARDAVEALMAPLIDERVADPPPSPIGALVIWAGAVAGTVAFFTTQGRRSH